MLAVLYVLHFNVDSNSVAVRRSENSLLVWILPELRPYEAAGTSIIAKLRLCQEGKCGNSTSEIDPRKTLCDVCICVFTYTEALFCRTNTHAGTNKIRTGPSPYVTP